MKELSTFHSDHCIIHISKDYERSLDRLKDYPYDLIVSSHFAHAPLNKDDLKRLADFIYSILENDKD
jgi:hypothetical protein